MEIRVKANSAIIVEQTADELRAELSAKFAKILNFEAAEAGCAEGAAEHPGVEGQVIANSISQFCRLLPAYHLDGEDALLVLRSIVGVCEQWNKRQELPA